MFLTTDTHIMRTHAQVYADDTECLITWHAVNLQLQDVQCEL